MNRDGGYKNSHHLFDNFMMKIESVKNISQTEPKIRQAAEALESMFLEQMFKVMRESVESNPMDLESSASKIYRSLLDSEVAKSAAGRSGQLGLAQQIIDYLEKGR